jgi:hypothetical protein
VPAIVTRFSPKSTLHLRAGRCFDTHGRDVGRSLRLPHRGHRALDGPEADDVSLIAQQPMHDHGILLGDTGIQHLGLAHDGVG